MGHPGSGYPPYPSYPSYPSYPPQQRNPADVAGAIVLMVLTVLGWALAAVMGVFSVAFLDHCPPATCSAAGAVNAVASAVIISGLLALAGVIVTIVRLATRKTAWPLALGTLLCCAAVVFLGAVGYLVAVS